MGKTYVEPGRAAVTGVFAQRQGGVSYGNFTAAALPTVNDDETLGYAPGSLWYYTTDGHVYVCVDATEGAAVWVDLETENQTVTVRVRSSDYAGGLTKGTVVYIGGATGNRPYVLKADADTEATSSKTFGVLAEDIAGNADGQCCIEGILTGLDLRTSNGWADGDQLWLSTTAGEFTKTIPAEPAHSVFIGTITRAHPTLGTIVVQIQNGYELNELHGVLLDNPPADGDVLTYETSSGLWKNKRNLRVLYSTATAVEVETEIEDVASYTIPINLLSTNADSVRGTYLGSNVDPTVKIAVYLGANKLAEVTDVAGGNWRVEVELFRLSSTTVNGLATFTYDSGATLANVLISQASLNLATTAYSLFLKIDTTAADVATLQNARVEFLPAP